MNGLLKSFLHILFQVYPECPIGFVADERPLDEDDEEVAGVIDDQQPVQEQTTAKNEGQLL